MNFILCKTLCNLIKVQLLVNITSQSKKRKITGKKMMELLCCEHNFILYVLQLNSSCLYCYQEMNQSTKHSMDS